MDIVFKDMRQGAYSCAMSRVENSDEDAVPPGALRLAPRIWISESAVEFSFVSSSGPGGQNVNKRATKCQLRIPLAAIPLGPAAAQRLATLASAYMTEAGELVISRDENKSQTRNKAACIDALSALVRQAAVAPKVRRRTRPTRGSIERRLKEKKHNSDRKRGRTGDE
jgi:ribosome-associated protein